MTKEEVMEAIIKEFPFIEFVETKESLIQGTLVPVYYLFKYVNNGGAIYIGENKRGEGVIAMTYLSERNGTISYISAGSQFKDYENSYGTLNEEFLKEKLYETMAKEFYIPYFRNDKINEILK